jgi:hypothetical protein
MTMPAYGICSETPSPKAEALAFGKTAEQVRQNGTPDWVMPLPSCVVPFSTQMVEPVN